VLAGSVHGRICCRNLGRGRLIAMDVLINIGLAAIAVLVLWLIYRGMQFHDIDRGRK